MELIFCSSVSQTVLFEIRFHTVRGWWTFTFYPDRHYHQSASI